MVATTASVTASTLAERGMAVDRGHFAEKSPRVEIGQDHLASGFRVDQNPYRSSDDEKDVDAVVLIIDDPFLCDDPAPSAAGIKRLDGGGRQQAEHRPVSRIVSIECRINQFLR
jgi:hypothetical protein